MAIREIPKSFEYTCDGCKTIHIQENANGCYADGRPRHWCRLKVSRSGYDVYQTDASVEKLLCSDCSDKIIKAINESLK